MIGVYQDHTGIPSFTKPIHSRIGWTLFQPTSMFMNHVKVCSWSNIGSWMPKLGVCLKTLFISPLQHLFCWLIFKVLPWYSHPALRCDNLGKPLWQRWMCGQLYVTNRFNVRQREKGGSGFAGQMQVSVFPRYNSSLEIYTWTLLPFAWIQDGKIRVIQHKKVWYILELPPPRNSHHKDSPPGLFHFY